MEFTDSNGYRDYSLNYSYGIRIYDNDTGKISTDKIPLFEEEGIDLVQKINEFNSGSGKGWANADAVDKVMVKIVNDKKQNDNGTGIIDIYKDIVELESYEIDALVDVSYHHGNCIPSSSSKELLKRYKAGNATKSEVINNFCTSDGFHPFTYAGNRTRALVQMFFDGKYIAGNGEEIPAGGDGILGCAKMVHDYMSDSEHLYYYCLWGSSNYEYVHRGVGLSCGLNNSFQE